ncbi:phosphatidylinositol mannoside acyltransferase [Gordonia sp. X0973]|uniref:phosphatidylinositol mannoside acyltransferase n=1 Tax=Gordonia sp. X0973 TaxID=2742602 RepID=UPI000F545178|nr:phosphatidylinositol mannoside acyltransferase [Gordonia sp. X0973]QKT07247.1 phosphatidylinositol mannoside acyltransferase [Gordonia sp. X0973]
MLDGVRDGLTDFGYRAGWAAVRYAPESLARGVFDGAGTIAGRRGGGPQQLRRNLGRVLGVSPEEVPDGLVAAAVRSYARYWREAFRLPSEDPARIVAETEISDADAALVDESFASGRGVVYALPHSGNWDTCGVWLVNRCGSFSTVAERLKPESLFDQFVEYRESLGFEVFPLTGGEQPPFRSLEERLRGGGLVCLMGDRDLSSHGVPVTFFGERTRMPAGPARLAQTTGAVLIAVHHCFTGPRTSRIRLTPIEVGAADSVEQVTQRLADAYQAGIASAPADWHMFQPLWEADWSEERRARLEDHG